VKVARHVRRLERQRPPDLIERSIEGAAGRQHADHRVRTVVEQNRSIDDRRVRTELSGLSRMPSTKLKMAVLAPMPRAKVSTAAAANPELFDRLRSA